MAKILPILVGLGVLVVGGGIAMAASQPATKTPKQRMFDALRTGDASVMQSTAVSLNAVAPTEAAGLQRASMFVAGLRNIPSDVAGSIIVTIRGLDVIQMKALAAILQGRGYPTQATDLNTLADFVAYEQSGGSITPNPKPETTVPGGAVGLPGVNVIVPSGQQSINDRVLAAIQSNDPGKMRAEAAKLRAEGHSLEAAALEAAATTAEATLAAGVPALPGVPNLGPPLPQVTPTAPPVSVKPPVVNPITGRPDVTAKIAAAIATGDSAKMRALEAELKAAGYEAEPWTLEAAAVANDLRHSGTIPQLPPLPTLPAAPPATPPVTVAPPATGPGKNRALADQTVTAVKTGTKGSAVQVATVQKFQTAEALTKRDGKYGSETATALADRYAIVPPQPLYWGPEKGTYTQYLADKTAYQKHLKDLASANKAPGSTQWTAAATQVKLSGDGFANELANRPTAPERLLAGKVALAVTHSTKVTAPRQLIAQFQTAERLRTTDGSYNSETALALAERFGIVPPKPLFWGFKGGTQQDLVNDKNHYRLTLARMMTADPQRADEWALAAKV